VSEFTALAFSNRTPPCSVCVCRCRVHRCHSQLEPSHRQPTAGAGSIETSEEANDGAYYDDDDALGDDAINALEFDQEQQDQSTAVVEEDQGDQTIVGGTPTNGQKDAPFFVRGEHGCGAALIAPDLVLGAAHCTAFYGSKVLVGSFQRGSTSGGLAAYRTVVSEKFRHPRFQITERGAQSYDMVLFKIESVLPQYPNLKPAELNADPTAVTPGSVLTMIGFGYTNWNESESSTLLRANVAAISNTECEQRYGRKPNFFDESVTCTIGSNSTNSSGSTSCFGDSGGPLVDPNGRLVGILSFGTKCTFR
jgi:trypsin